MTPTQRERIIEGVRSGKKLENVARAIKVPIREVREDLGRDDEFAEAVEAAMAEAGSKKPEPPPPPPPAPPVRQAVRRTAEKTTEPTASPFDPARVTEEAAQFAPGPLGFLLWLDARCVAHGFPALSDWWRWSLREFYESAKRWGLYRVGRGGGKSTSLVRVAASEGLFGEREIPPGQRWVWPFISVSTGDAARRIREIQAVNLACGLTVTPKVVHGAPTIELEDMRGQAIAFMSIAGTIANVSGPSTIGATLDEEAKLRDKSTNANPATEILASLLQTFRARPGIRAIRCSSAWSTTGSHAEAIAEGDTSMNYIGRIGKTFLPIALQGLQEVARWEESHGNAESARRIREYAATVTEQCPNVPTWVANPTISAIASREEIDALPAEILAGAPRVTYWLRENASVPMLSMKGSAVGNLNDGIGAANRAACARVRAAIEGQNGNPFGGIRGGYSGLEPGDPRGILRTTRTRTVL